jgi:hypothetical protein
MKYLKITILLLYSIISTGQEINSELKKQLAEIENYKIFIDSTSKNYKEGIAEGPIIYNKLFRKNGGWSAYYLSEKENKPLRIRYSQTGIKTYENLNMYYKNNELIFAEFTEESIKRKKKSNVHNQTKFYFQNGELLHQSNLETTNLDLSELLREEKQIRKYYYKVENN